MNRFGRFLDVVLSAFYPERCAVCGEVIEGDKTLCDKCKNDIFPIMGEVCHKCGVGLYEHDETKCRECDAEIIAPFYYRGSARNIIIDFKDTKRRKYYDYFAMAFYELIAREYSDIDFDMTVCVPSKGRRKSTSRIICEETAKHFFLGFDPFVLEKYRETEKQHRLSMEDRFHNLENSIRVREGMEGYIKGRTILLCDDVKTTGTTLSVCAKALYDAGAKAVYCACLCVSDFSTKK